MPGITRHPQGEPGGRARGFGVGQEIARLVEEARLAHIVGDPAAFIDQRGDAGPVRAHHCVDVFGLVGFAAKEQQAAQGVQVGLAPSTCAGMAKLVACSRRSMASHQRPRSWVMAQLPVGR